MYLICLEQVALVTLSGSHFTWPQVSGPVSLSADKQCFEGATHPTTFRQLSWDELNYPFYPIMDNDKFCAGAEGNTGHQPGCRHQHLDGFMNTHPCLTICTLSPRHTRITSHHQHGGCEHSESCSLG